MNNFEETLEAESLDEDEIPTHLEDRFVEQELDFSEPDRFNEVLPDGTIDDMADYESDYADVSLDDDPFTPDELND